VDYTKGKWEYNEDIELRKAVETFGSEDWGNVARHLMNKGISRSARQSRIRYLQYIDSTMKRGIWDDKEDQLLLDAINEHGMSWGKVAIEIQKKGVGRSADQCRKRYINNLTPNVRKGPWDESEDDKLVVAVKEMGYKWADISRKLLKDGVKRSANQCRKRYVNHINPDLRKGRWKKAEDEKLLSAVEVCGKDWGQVSRILKESDINRSSDQCRQRYKDYLNPKLVTGDWTKEEDQKIVEGFKKYGRQWSLISSTLPGRNRYSVVSRWDKLKRKRDGSDDNDTDDNDIDEIDENPPVKKRKIEPEIDFEKEEEIHRPF